MKIEPETKKSTSQQEPNPSQNVKEKSNIQPKNFFINYKDLFLTPESEPIKENKKNKEKEAENIKKKENKENLSYLSQLYTFPQITDESFTNKDFKFRFQSNKNIRFLDEYTASYIGKGVSKIDYGTVQPEKEITNSKPVFYFEVFIKDDGKEGDILIGLGEKDITEKCLSLGSTSRSFGYHSKAKSHNNKKTNKYGEIYAKGDTIGCGVDLENKSIFYTKNGKFLDYAFKDINFEFGKGYLYPSICMHTLNSQVVINFGNDNFKFDIKGYYENNLGKKYDELQKINPKLDEMDALIKEYLFHEGYLKTLKSMTSSENQEKKEEKNIEKKKEAKDDNTISNNDFYLDIDDKMKIDEIKSNENKIIIGDNNNNLMEIEEDEYNFGNDENLIESILNLLPKNNIREKKDQDKEKKEEKDEKKNGKKEKKKEEKKEENKEEKKDDKKEEKKDEKKEEKKEDKKEEKKDEKKEDKNEDKKDKMEIEEKKGNEKEKEKIEEKEKQEKEKQEKKENLKNLINFRRKIMNYFSNNEFDKVIILLKDQNIKEKEEIKKKIYFNIMIMKYITLLKNENNYIACFELLDSFEKEYWDKYKILLYENDSFNETKLFSVQNLATLVSQPDIINSNDAFFLNEKQITLIKNQINSMLFEMFNFSPISNLGKVYAHLEYMNGLYFKIFNCNQELNLKLD